MENRKDTKKEAIRRKLLNKLNLEKMILKNILKTQSSNSDIIISFNQLEDTNQMTLDVKINNNIDIESFLIPLNTLIIFIINNSALTSKSYHNLSFNTGITKEDTEYVAYLLLPDLEDIISIEPKWESEFNGIIQLIQLLAIKYSLKSE